jgi:hypothetical protein
LALNAQVTHPAEVVETLESLSGWEKLWRDVVAEVYGQRPPPFSGHWRRQLRRLAGAYSACYRAATKHLCKENEAAQDEATALMYLNAAVARGFTQPAVGPKKMDAAHIAATRS